MTTRNLHALFEPKAIALVGASNRMGSVGQVLARNLLESGFTGPVMPVNPRALAVRSSLAYASIAELPATPDLAVVATPPASLPGVIAELGARGCRAAVVITAGVDAETRQGMLDASRPHLLRIVGPNCLGFISPRVGINASFGHLTPKAGGIALVAQSGAVAAAAMDWAHARGIGFSHMVSVGDACDVDFGDLLDYLALDAETKAILVYVESIQDARKFMTAGRIAARAKPVVVIKAGRSAAGAKAAFSHTGALAGSDAVYDAAFRRAGMLRVEGLRELFDAVATLSAGLRVRGDRLAILTNGGGAGVMAVDALDARGGRLAELAPETLAALNAVAPKAWSHANPVDILGDAKPFLYGAALEALLKDKGADAVLVMNCPVAVADSTQAADAVIEVLDKVRYHRPVLTCWMGETAVAEGRRRLMAAGAPAHETPDEAVRAFMHLANHKRNQDLLLQTPAAGLADDVDLPAAEALIAQARAEGRLTLSEPESRALLAAYGIPVVESRTVADPAGARAAADELGGSVALKILSADISHKSDVGGVALNLAGGPAAEAAAQAMLARVRERAPDARIDGFVLQPMISRPKAQELIAGVVQDPAFGPVVLFGSGGVAVEVAADRSMGLPPLDDVLARDMIARTRVSRLLAGYRDRPAADLDAVAEVLVRLSRLATDLPEVAELDINPLLADADGVLGLDGRVRLTPPGAEPPAPAIHPYPDEMVHEAALAAEPLTIRPVRPQDAPKLAEMVEKTAPEDVRLRFRSGFTTLPPGWPQRLSQIDYDREMALAAENAAGEIVGVSRLVADPEGESAEFALLVRTDHHKMGLGRLLLSEIVEHGRDRGLKEIWGDVARDNSRMRDMAKALGFHAEASEDVSRVKVVKRFDPAAPPVAGQPATS